MVFLSHHVPPDQSAVTQVCVAVCIFPLLCVEDLGKLFDVVLDFLLSEHFDRANDEVDSEALVLPLELLSGLTPEFDHLV